MNQGGRVTVFDGPDLSGKNGAIEDSDPTTQTRQFSIPQHGSTTLVLCRAAMA